MLVTLGSFCVPVFIFSCIIHSGGYDPIWCCLFEPQMLQKMYTQPLIVPGFPSNSKISQKNSQSFYEIPSNSMKFPVILRFHKKFPVILRNCLEFLGMF